MRKKLFEMAVTQGTPLITEDLSSEALILVVIPAGTAQVLVEQFNVRDLGTGLPVDLRTVVATDATSMSALVAADVIAKRTAIIAVPGVTGIKVTVSVAAQTARVVGYGVGV